MFYDYVHILGSGFILEMMTIHKILISTLLYKYSEIICHIRRTQSKHFSSMLKTDHIHSEKDVK